MCVCAANSNQTTLTSIISVGLPVWTCVNVYSADANLGKKNRKKHNKAHRGAFVCVKYNSRRSCFEFEVIVIQNSTAL